MLEQLIAQGRVGARRVRARLPGGPAALRPVRLVLRLNDLDAPDGWTIARGGALDLDGWRALLLGFIHWLGPLRVTVAGGRPERSEHLEPLLRFARRLDCPTQLILSGGLDRERVGALVGGGLSALTVRLPGPGGEAAPGLELLAAARAARDDWGHRLRLLAAIPLEHSPRQAARLAAMARSAGADDLLGCLSPGAATGVLTGATRQSLGPGELTPQHLLDGVGRPLPGGARAELLCDGSLLVASSGPAAGRVDPADPAASWAAAGEALAAARAMSRPWDELELVPGLLL